jgi:hypothetical protein
MTTSDETPGPRPGRWSLLRRGLLEPSLGAVATALVVASSCALGALAFGQPERLLALHPYLAEEGWDRPPFITVEVLRELREEGDPPRVMVLGASGMQFAVAGGEMTEVLRKATGESELRVLNMTAWGQSSWEMMAIAEALSPVLEGVVVFGVSPDLFTRPRGRLGELVSTPRYGFPSPAVDAEAARESFEVPRRTGVYLWDQRGYFFSRLMIARNRWLQGPAPSEPPPLEPPSDWSDEMWHELDERYAAELSLYESNADYHAELLVRLVQSLQSRGVRPLVVEAPWNPRARREPGLHELHRLHTERMTALSATLGVTYARLDLETELEPGEFMDLTHLGSHAAQSRFTRALAERIAAELERCAC